MELWPRRCLGPRIDECHAGIRADTGAYGEIDIPGGMTGAIVHEIRAALPRVTRCDRPYVVPPCVQW